MIYEKEKRYIIPFDDVPSPRAAMPEISVDERRGNFLEVETGFAEETAVGEAKRCLSCRRCLGCALCWAECKPEAIDFSIPDQKLHMDFDAVILTPGQDNRFKPVDARFGYGRYAEVLSDLQFERMLSPTGPTAGLVLSPANGEIPGRIAIIQPCPEADPEHLLRATVLGVNEAIVALDRAQDLEVVLITPICEAFKEKFLAEAAQVAGLRILEATAEAVERDAEEGRLKVGYRMEGETRSEAFDMVVILTEPETPPEVLALSRQLDLPVN